MAWVDHQHGVSLPPTWRGQWVPMEIKMRLFQAHCCTVEPRMICTCCGLTGKENPQKLGAMMMFLGTRPSGQGPRSRVEPRLNQRAKPSPTQVQLKSNPSPTQVQTKSNASLHQFKPKLQSDNHSPTRCQFVTNESALVLVLLGLLAFVGLAGLLRFFGFLGLWSGFLIRLIG